MRKLTLIITLMLIMAASCSTDEPILQQETEDNLQKNAKTAVSKNDAVKIANFFLDQISQSPTRANGRKVSKIDAVLNDTPTRSDEPDTLLYVINFDEDQGYAIVSADARAYPVFAMSDNGFFEINDATSEGVKMYIENAKSTVKKMSEGSNEVFNTNDLTTSYFDPITRPTIGPLISERQAKVGDCPELNKYVVDSEGNHTHTCCVPVAVEIAMSYHKWPTTLEGYSFNWDAMNSGNDDDGIARLLAILSSDGYCPVSHKVNQDGIVEYASSKRYVIPTLKKCNYIVDAGFEIFERDNDMICEQLSNIGPMLIDARSANGRGGHIWVLDGYKEAFYKPVESDYAAIQKCSFYHCVWGNYKGGCNGYYLAWSSKYFDGAPEFYDDKDPGNNFCEECWVFDYGQRSIVYLGNFKPNPWVLKNDIK